MGLGWDKLQLPWTGCPKTLGCMAFGVGFWSPRAQHLARCHLSASRRLSSTWPSQCGSCTRAIPGARTTRCGLRSRDHRGVDQWQITRLRTGRAQVRVLPPCRSWCSSEVEHPAVIREGASSSLASKSGSIRETPCLTTGTSKRHLRIHLVSFGDPSKPRRPIPTARPAVRPSGKWISGQRFCPAWRAATSLLARGPRSLRLLHG
jgi:hypothetical protein